MDVHLISGTNWWNNKADVSSRASSKHTGVYEQRQDSKTRSYLRLSIDCYYYKSSLKKQKRDLIFWFDSKLRSHCFQNLRKICKNCFWGILSCFWTCISSPSTFYLNTKCVKGIIKQERREINDGVRRSLRRARTLYFILRSELEMREWGSMN